MRVFRRLKMGSRIAEVDRLSLLPDELLGQILSLMPTESAVRTSILSRRWKYCWTLVHSFDFRYIDRIPHSCSFMSIVDRVLKLCNASQVILFRLHIYGFEVGNSSLSKWINEAARLNIREVDMLATEYMQLPLSLFTCKTLTKLKLAVVGYGSYDLHVPSEVILPCLKTLDISLFNRTPFVQLFKLTGGCPVLESLTLSLKLAIWGYDNKEYNFNIPTLKRFELRTPRRTLDISKVVLNVPNLEYLFLGGFLSSHFVMEDFPSLIEANVSFYEEEDTQLISELLDELSGAKWLSWSSSDNCILFDFPVPKFPNLKHLEFTGFSYHLMFQILQRSCVLEHLCIKEPVDFYGMWPLSVPTCMLSHLETLKLINFKRRDIMFLEYLLANSMVLRTLTIKSKIWHPADEAWLYDQFLRFPRASNCCKIYFEWDWSYSTCN